MKNGCAKKRGRRKEGVNRFVYTREGMRSTMNNKAFFLLLTSHSPKLNTLCSSERLKTRQFRGELSGCSHQKNNDGGELLVQCLCDRLSLITGPSNEQR